MMKGQARKPIIKGIVYRDGKPLHQSEEYIADRRAGMSVEEAEKAEVARKAKAKATKKK